MTVYIIVKLRAALIDYVESVWDEYDIAMAEQRRLERAEPRNDYIVLKRTVNQRKGDRDEHQG